MLAVKYLVKLYDLPERHGTVTAFDTYANTLFVGTSHGTLLKLLVEGLPEYPTASHDAVEACESNSEAASTAGMPSSAPIFTSVVAQAVVATSGGDSGSSDEPVSQLQHSRTRALLFVLCEHRLTLWHSDSLTRLHDLLAPESPKVSTFFVSHVTASGECGGISDSGQGLQLADEQEKDKGCEVHLEAVSPHTASLSDAMHVIYAAEYMGKGLHVYEYDADAAGTRGMSGYALLCQDFVLPEPVEAVVAQGDIICVGMRREYSVLSVSTGSSRSVLRRGGTAGATALLALGENEVFMRQHRTVFSIALQPRRAIMAQTRTTSDPMSPSSCSSSASSVTSTMSPASQPHHPLPRSPSSPTTTTTTTTMTVSPAMGRVLSRTTPLEDEVRLMLVRFPFLFVFTDDYCDVFSVFDAEVTERLPLPGGLFGSQLARGGDLFVAGRRQVWLAGLHALRHQLADLVEQYKIDEAFELLAVQAGRQRGRRQRQQQHQGGGQGDSGAELRAMARDLHVMAGFAHLHRCHPSRAMRHFDDHLDPRDLLLHLPACLPPPYSSFAATPEGENNTHKDSGVAGCDMARVIVRDLDEAVAHNVPCETTTEGETVARDDDNGEGNKSEKRGFWHGWRGPNPYNTYVGELSRAWRETFQTFPRIAAPTTSSSSLTASAPPPPVLPGQGTALPSPTPSLSSSTTAFVDVHRGACSQPELRLLPELGPTSLAVFRERGWCALKTALVRYFHDRLARLDEPCTTTTTSITFRRAMEYALLVLYLEQRDHRGVYALLARRATALCVEDCHDLLLALHEYRLLALFLYRHGHVRQAHALLRSRVYVSSYLPRCLPSDHASVMEDASVEQVAKVTTDTLRGHVARHVQSWLDTTLNAQDCDGCSSAMRSLVMLPPSIRSAVASRLLSCATGNGDEGSAKCSMTGKDEDTLSAAEEWRWWQKMTRHYVEQAVQPARWARMCYFDTARTTARPSLVYAMLHCGPVMTVPTFCQISSRRLAPMPGSLAEAFYLIDKLDLFALRQLLHERPQEADVCDEEGSTPLHVCLSLFCLLHRSATTALGSVQEALSKKESNKETEAPIDDAELVRRLLNAAVLLVNAGTQTSAVNLQGCSCLDVLLAALPSDCARDYLDLVTATLLATVEVNVVCRRAVTEPAADT